MTDVSVPKPDYLSRDFQGLKEVLVDYASRRFPEWQPSSEGDFGMVLLELFAYTGDILSYYTDRAQFENYLPTATQRDSVLALAYLLGYMPNSGSPARGTLQLVTDKGFAAVTVPAGTKFTTGRIAAIDGPVTFETDADVTVPANAASNATIAVTEGETEYYARIGESTGLPAQMLLLPHTGVYRDTIRIYVEDSTGSEVFTSGTTTITAREWLLVDHLLDAEATDTRFETQYTEDSVLVKFGDDINGAIPATGLQVFATYRHGVGANGNVAAGEVKLLNDRSVKGVHVARDSNDAYLSSAMAGGTDPESVDSIRFNAPRAYRTQSRVVTLDDFKDAALGVEGVSKANVLAATYTSVTVYVAGPDGGTPTQTLLDLVEDSILGKTLAGVSVTVAAPTFVPVNFGSSGSPIAIEVWPQYSQKGVRNAVRRAIRAFVGNMAFGEKLSVGKIYKAIEAVDGVRHVDIPVMARDDAAQSGTARITPREWEIFTVNSMYFSMSGGVA